MMRVLVLLVLACSVVSADPGRRVVTDTKIEILDTIHFVGTSATLSVTSTRILDAIAETLKGNPSIRVMEVIAYGSDVPTDQVVLGTRRAKAVVDALVRRGVPAKRLRFSGEARSDSRDQGPRLLILDRAP
jgi:outer membrane protein OmpA-like peptidoglycan-associated protein